MLDNIKVEELQNLVNVELTSPNEEQIKIKENAILKLGDVFVAHKEGLALADLIKRTRPFLHQISKAKAGKLVRTLVDLFLDLECGTGQEISLCQECIEWANAERRVYLRQALETRLMGLYFENGLYSQALNLGATLLKELKKLDDKALLVEVQLLESKVYERLSNLQKSRAALTSARTTANGIFCPAKLQAALDMQSGVLHAADERDFKTAFSYFYEAFEGYNSMDNTATTISINSSSGSGTAKAATGGAGGAGNAAANKAVEALRCMLMCKIMLNSSEEVPAILSSKLAAKYAQLEQVQVMRKVADAAHKRSLSDYNKIMKENEALLSADCVISKHLYSLYDTLLCQNLLKLTEPYSRVQIAHVAQLINLPQDVVERKLSQMILDKTMNGFLDQGRGVLVLLQEQTDDKGYKTAIDTIHDLSKVIDQLYQKAKLLT